MKKYYYIKLLADKVLCSILIMVLAPLLIVTAVIIKLTSKGPVLFVQKRIGQNGKIFDIYKFRSMKVGAENEGSKNYSFKGDPRVTKIGKFIRATSIDELPQLFNIIKGDMSIIGPRPVLTYFPWEYSEYSQEQLKRFIVKPGVSGLAQINGRKQVDWDKRIVFDCEYVDRMSLLLDIKILFITIYQVLLMKDNLNTIQTNKGAK